MTSDPILDKPLKVAIIDPTSRCNNACTYCGQNSTPNGVDLPSKDIAEIFRSGSFEVENSTPFYSPKNSRFGRKIQLIGGGEPTLHPEFLDIVITLSEHASVVEFLTGGMNPDIDPYAIMGTTAHLGCNDSKLIAGVSHHPFSSPGHDNRIAKTVETLWTSGVSGLMLKLKCFQNEFVDGLPQKLRASFHYLTETEFYATELWSRIGHRFSIPFAKSKGVSYDDLSRLKTNCMEVGPGSDMWHLSPNAETTIHIDGGLRPSGKALMHLKQFLQFYGVQYYIHPRDFISSLITQCERAPSALRVTAHGYITGCHSSLPLGFENNPDAYEGDLYGHSAVQIAHNRTLFISHLIRACREWLDSGESMLKGTVCDTLCKKARIRFIEDQKRFPSRRGNMGTVLRARAVAR